MQDELCHHGTLGQKWGVRRYQNKDGSLTPEGRVHYGVDQRRVKEKESTTKFRYTNLDDWGKDKDHNLLAITGPSGSGKSTLAKHFAKERGADVIMLDAYYDQPKKNISAHSKSFDKYLAKRVPEYTELMESFDKYEDALYGNNDNEKTKALRKHYWKIMDQVRDAMFDYAKESYPNKPVIAEGVQWSDTTLYDNEHAEEGKKRMAGMPFVVMETSAVMSTIRRELRDHDKINAKTILQAFGDYKVNKEWQKQVKEKEAWVKEVIG